MRGGRACETGARAPRAHHHAASAPEARLESVEKVLTTHSDLVTLSVSAGTIPSWGQVRCCRLRFRWAGWSRVDRPSAWLTPICVRAVRCGLPLGALHEIRQRGERCESPLADPEWCRDNY